MTCDLCGWHNAPMFAGNGSANEPKEAYFICKFCYEKMKRLIEELRMSSAGLSSIQINERLRLEFRSSHSWKIFSHITEGLDA